MVEKTTDKELVVSWIQSAWQGSEADTVAHYLTCAQSLESVNLIVFPELMLNEYFPLTEDDLFFAYAKPIDHPVFEQFRSLAQVKKAVVVVPFYEEYDGHYYNSAQVFDADGSRAGIYRKMHIPYDPGFYEKYYFEEGNMGFTPIVTSIGSLGVLICWDQWFPEAARLMALQGADLLIYPTAIGWDDTEPESVNKEQLEAWQTSMRAHSIANGIHTIAVNRIGKEGKIDFWGNSFISKPSGQLINTPHMNEESYRCVINLKDTKTYLDTWPFFRDRRVDAFKGILEKGVESVQTGMTCERVWKK